jgi:hypothetical protein
MDKGAEFETWFAHELPWRLRLSPSKQVGMKIKFGKFADIVRPLAQKAPKEFESFFNGLRKGVEEVSHFRATKGKVVGPSVYKGKIETYPNGIPVYLLVDK